MIIMLANGAATASFWHVGYYMFKTNVQSGGRISIPEAERQALGIEEGDLVQVIIIPLARKQKNSQKS